MNLLALALASFCAFPSAVDDPAETIDLLTLSAGVDPLTRVTGFGQSLGSFGLPVAGNGDIDGDGFNDFAVAHFMSDPLGRTRAGEVNVVFGNGLIADDIVLGSPNPRILQVIGAGNLGAHEGTGSEVWMGDVTGDGTSDLLICRQNYSFDPGTGPRYGAGALTIVVGGPELEVLASSGTTLDLQSPHPSVTVFSLLGREFSARLGMWARVGDVDGDGTDDLVVAADQESSMTTDHYGAVYVVRGGAHLDQNAEVDLANLGSTILVGQIARIRPPAGNAHLHLGSTNQVGDLDGNGRAEILISGALNRIGGIISPGLGGALAHGTGGVSGGRAYVLWDDNFPAAPWPAGYQIVLDATPGSLTTIDGGDDNRDLGEELLCGKDYDGDGNAELFVGDFFGDGTGGSRPLSGVGYVFYNAALLKGLSFNMNNAASMGIAFTTILGPSSNAICADTVAHGDFDGDGLDDLMLGSPTDDPLGRSSAGTMQILFGRCGQWPSVIDMAPGAFPPSSEVRITEVLGRHGSASGDAGDTLAYSGDAGDIDGDGRDDLIVNEMRGNGVGAGTIDAGNLIILSGAFLSPRLGANSDCNANGVLDACDIEAGTSLDGNSNGIPDECDGTASQYCATTPNSADAVGGIIGYTGSINVGANDLVLQATGIPNSVGIFFFGNNQTNVPFGNGIRCVSGQIFRLSPAMATSGNMATRAVDFTSSGNETNIGPGETWNFQFWFRDTPGGGAGFNLSDGLEILFGY